jgi:hypothetical protein
MFSSSLLEGDGWGEKAMNFSQYDTHDECEIYVLREAENRKLAKTFFLPTETFRAESLD